MNNKARPEYPGWNIERELGHGSYGSVYEISRDIFGKKERAALKQISIPENNSEIQTLRTEGHSEETITSYFESHLQDVVSEYSVMVDLKSHPNVVYCDDLRYVQHDDGIGWDIFIKMELLTPLKQYVKSYYSESDTLKLGKDLCSALVLCRQKNIIHRDIKPENIFISETGSFKLGDFGIAKVTDKTASGTKIGTFEYMAPEVYNNQPYSFTADVYAVGLVMYWMMNGKRTPFLPQNRIPSATDKENARKRRFGGDKLPAPANGSEKLQEIVLKACAFDPKDRYQSAAEMLQALDRMHADEVMDTSGDPTVGVWEKQPVENGEQKESEETETVCVSPNTRDANENADTHVEKQEDSSNLQDGDITVRGEIQNESGEIEPESKESKKKNIAPVFVGIFAVLIVLLVMFIPKFSGNSVESKQPTPTPPPTPVHEHQWIDATYAAPKTCATCGATEGTRLVADPIYLNELGVSNYEGKIWTRSQERPSGHFHTNKDVQYDSSSTKKCWANWTIPGHTVGTVRDHYGNEYTYGMFIDGKDSQAYFVEFNLDGKYTKFTGTCACPEKDSAVSRYVHNEKTLYSKYFEVYLDGKYIGSSPSMRCDFAPQAFSFDVTGAGVLRILYPPSKGPNEIASIYDGMLS